MLLDITRRRRLQRLLDSYSELLTEHQRETLRLHIESDWSYAEIAAVQGVTRMAVYDLVHRTEGLLDDYEAKLGLVAADDRRRKDRDALTGRLHELQAEISQLRRSVKDLS